MAAALKIFHYPDLESLKAHVLAFVSAYNFAKHIKTLRWKTPFEAICHAWTTKPDIFKLDPRHLIPGPYTPPNPGSGAKTVRPGAAAIDVLRALPRVGRNPYVISGAQKGEHLTDLQRPWRRIRQATTLGNVRTYDLSASQLRFRHRD